MRRDRTAPLEPDVRAGMQMGIGCLVGGAALGGTLILVFIVAFLFQPPAWLQIVLGVALAAGATSFAWLFTSALRRSDMAARSGDPARIELADRAERSEQPRALPRKGESPTSDGR